MALQNNFMFRFFWVALAIVLMARCEQDDICISDVPETPELVILMIESESTSRKTPPGFLIRPIGTDSLLRNSRSDSLALPLKRNESNTQFEFIINQGLENENIDTLQFNYDRWDRFVSSACGFTAHYIFNENPVTLLNPGSDWIKGVIILNDTVFNEKNAHLGILY